MREGGDAPVDRQIAALQKKIKAAPEERRAPFVEQLGWAFVSKARLSNDPGYDKLAEQCALWLETQSPKNTAALLLHGHLLDTMHRFPEAEKTARELVKLWPTGWEAYALLGDALMEQGQLSAAVEAYQSMVDIKPCAQTYLRVAHVRWLKGDLEGALEMLTLSVEAGSSRDPEPAAWAYARLALYRFQAGDSKAADHSLERALAFVPNYAPALLLRGKMLLAEDKNAEAVEALKIAAQENPLPEYEWVLADAQRAAGLAEAAAKTEARLAQGGAANDPRTYALFLATRGENADMALKLARAELENRRDIFTLDALAWASLAAGKIEEARTDMRAALAEGTQDTRLFLHAGVIASAAGKQGEAAGFFQKASAIRQMLLPSERSRLEQGLAAISRDQKITAEPNPQTTTAQTGRSVSKSIP